MLGVLDRDAIRHATMVEGNFDDMLDAIRKIKQIINQGLIEGSGQRAKPLSLYGPEYADILETIDIHVGQISSIVRRNYNPHHQLLPWEAAAKVDQERTVMVDAVNKFAEAHGHTRRIAVWHGY